MNAYKTALITGASSGIGAAFAATLARAGSDLILVARSEDKLRQLAGELTRETGRNIQVIAADLSKPDAGARLRKQVDALEMAVDLLINNAGFGTQGAFEQQDAAREAEEIRLNASAVVDLSHAFLPPMLDARHGAIINIASSAAFQPMPFFAVYAATKAFVYSFSDALNEELRGRGVHVMSVCPGPVDTAFFEATGAHNLRKKVPKGSMVSAQYIVDASLAGLASRSRVVVPGGMTKIAALATAVAPRAVVTRLVGRIMRG